MYLLSLVSLVSLSLSDPSFSCVMAATVMDNMDCMFAPDAAVSMGDAGSGMPSEPEKSEAMTQLHSFIDREIEERMAKVVSWKKLDLCFKWIRIREYLQTTGVKEDDPCIRDLRELVESNKLPHIEYDTEQQKVTRLGHGNL